MVPFDELLLTAPAVAEPIQQRLTRTGIALLGTVRRNGSPRVSPIEVVLHRGRLWLGMMPGSRKLADVRRDPRVMLLTSVADRTDTGGEGKLSGVLAEVRDPAVADDVLGAAAAQAGFDPDDVRGSPLFEVLVREAAWQGVEGDQWVTWSWRHGDRVRLRRRVGATGLPVEVEPPG